MDPETTKNVHMLCWCCETALLINQPNHYVHFAFTRGIHKMKKENNENETVPVQQAACLCLSQQVIIVGFFLPPSCLSLSSISQSSAGVYYSYWSVRNTVSIYMTRQYSHIILYKWKKWNKNKLAACVPYFQL